MHFFFWRIPLQAVPPSNGLDDHGYLRNRTNIENYDPEVPFESQGRPRSEFDPNATFDCRQIIDRYQNFTDT